MIQTMYVGMCDTCGDATLLDPKWAEAHILENEDQTDENLPIIVSRCALVRELDSGEATCEGNIELRGCLPLCPLPSAYDIREEKLRTA